MLFVLCLMTAVVSPAQEAELEGRQYACLRVHVRDAIELNEQRKPVYSRLSQGRSDIISEKMIRMEKRLLWVAPLVDAWAWPYQKSGIPIMCAEFIDMSATPPFRAVNPEGTDDIRHYQPPVVTAIQEDLEDLYKARSYTEMAQYADKVIRSLEKSPRYNCLFRHFMESIRRVAALTPKHAKQAREKNMLPTQGLSRVVLKSHINMLREAAHIDSLAAPLQAEALPILCQDVPHIPWP